jgi:hypothetical protein
MRITVISPTHLTSSSSTPSEHEEHLLTTGYHNRSWYYQDTETTNTIERDSMLSLTNTNRRSHLLR